MLALLGPLRLQITPKKSRLRRSWARYASQKAEKISPAAPNSVNYKRETAKFFSPLAKAEIGLWPLDFSYCLGSKKIAMYNYTKRLRGDLKICNCQHTNHKSPIDFRRAHVCTRQSSERYDEVWCAARCLTLPHADSCCHPLPHAATR